MKETIKLILIECIRNVSKDLKSRPYEVLLTKTECTGCINFLCLNGNSSFDWSFANSICPTCKSNIGDISIYNKICEAAYFYFQSGEIELLSKLEKYELYMLAYAYLGYNGFYYESLINIIKQIIKLLNINFPIDIIL